MTTIDSPPVAIANREFAREMFGSVANAIGRYCRMQDGTRVQIVGVVEDGKYLSLNEDQQPALFLLVPAIAIERSVSWWCAPSAIRKNLPWP